MATTFRAKHVVNWSLLVQISHKISINKPLYKRWPYTCASMSSWVVVVVVVVVVDVSFFHRWSIEALLSLVLKLLYLLWFHCYVLQPLVVFSQVRVCQCPLVGQACLE